jgi:phage terminase small subunit
MAKNKPRAVGYPRTNQQLRWCVEYLKDLNACAAAVRVGYSKKVASTHASSWVAKYEDYLNQLRSEKARELAKEIIHDEKGILFELGVIAKANSQDYVELVPVKVKKGKSFTTEMQARLKSVEKLTREQAGAIKTMIETKDGRVIYELHSKVDANRTLGMHYGTFNQKIAVEHRHRHSHTMQVLKDVPTENLQKAESALIALLGPAARAMLGEQAELDPIPGDG